MASKYVYTDPDEIEITTLVAKHGSHDQKTHGSWATGSEGKVLTSLIDRLAEKKTPGFSIDIRTKKSPKTGYMCSIDGAERQVKLDKWNSVDNDGKRAIIEQYKKDNMGALSKRGAYFGAWKVVQDGVIYLDVSRRYESKSEGIGAGIANRQKSIYDVVKDAYIYMEDENDGTRANKARTGGVGQTSERDDSRGIGRADGRNPDGNRGQSVSFPHICLGRYSVVGIQKHLEGQHDQATHGNWAGDRYPADSVKSARDGAKEYAFKKGLNPDETIDYTKVVANRERASKIADIYESLPTMDRDAVDEYEALASEVEEQFNFMTKTLGVKVEFVADDPYKTSKEMFDDVSKGTLKVLQTETTGAHPIFSDEQNNKFRAVHDYFGHAATGRGFGQDGEESAWVHHSQMFTQKATAALTTETRGQNSFFNNRGKQFADQKVALLPEEFWAVPKVFQKGYQVIYFAPGLKPVLKHEEHDQSTHGSWATGGYTEEESQRIADMADIGPSIEDLNSMLDGAPNVGDEDLQIFVSNDRGLYEQATDGIDKLVAAEMIALQVMYPNHKYSEQEKMEVHERIQNQMITEFIENDDGTIRQAAIEASGYEGIDSDTATMFFNDVYALNHTGVGRTGETRELYSEISMTEIYPNQGIMVRGDVKDQDDESVAGIERTFSRDANGVWNVKHDYFMFNDDRDKGTGFGKVFLQQSEDWYTARGFGSISLYTAAEGAVHWARQGFDFDEKYLVNNLSTLARNFPTDNPKFLELMQRATNGYVPSDGSFDSVKPMTTDRFPTPAEFALIGYTKGATEWMGANVMYGLRMDYKKTLTAEGRNLISSGGVNNITGYYETAGSENPVDRDGDGLVFDGTAREKPVPKKTK
jgi:hypothetical protein